jgi:hypothetical protein
VITASSANCSKATARTEGCGKAEVHERIEEWDAAGSRLATGEQAVTEEQDLVRSAMMARDVIESYRQSDVTVSGWSLTLEEAAQSFARISAHRPVADEAVPLAQLAQTLSSTARAGLQADRETLDRLSQELRTIVIRTRIPGIPLPEDEDWSF